MTDILSGSGSGRNSPIPGPAMPSSLVGYDRRTSQSFVVNRCLRGVIPE